MKSKNKCPKNTSMLSCADCQRDRGICTTISCRKPSKSMSCAILNETVVYFTHSISRTKETLATGNLLSVINVLMQLRKVCNHPNLFEPRPIVSPFQVESIVYYTASQVYGLLDYNPFEVKQHCINFVDGFFT